MKVEKYVATFEFLFNGITTQKESYNSLVKFLMGNRWINEHGYKSPEIHSLRSDKNGVCEVIFIGTSQQNIEENLSLRQEADFKKKVLYSCLNKLNDREQYIIKNRMLSDKGITLEEIGTKFNISRERVRQIEKKAFEKLSDLVRMEMTQAQAA